MERFNAAIVRLWFPVNLIFVGMIFTSFFALKNLGVPMATVLKNLTNLFTIAGDYFLYKKVRQRVCSSRCCSLFRLSVDKHHSFGIMLRKLEFSTLRTLS